ncbi:MAG: hypothetical protein ACO1RT_14020 [Planctomycetaceae bacterium]
MFTCLATTLAAEPADANTQAEVQRLVEELDAPQLSRRNAAEQALIKLGEPALQWLPPPDRQLPGEVKQRLVRIRDRIARQAATASVAKGPNEIRLGTAATLGAALEAISRDSGVEFEHTADEDKPIAPYDTPLTFWNALDHVLDQADLDVDFYAGEDGEIALRPRAPDRPNRVDSAAYTGIYRLEPIVVTSRRILRDAKLSGLGVELEVSWNPNSHPVGITLPLKQIAAELDDGAVVRAQHSEGTIDIAPSNEIAMTTIQLPLALPAGRPQKIKALSGRIQSMLPGAIKPFEFPLKLGIQTQTADFVTVRVEEIRKNAGLHEIRLGVEYKSPGKAMESHRGWLLGNEVYVTMPDGGRQDHLGYELYRHNENGLGIGYLFDVGDSPGEAKLIYNTPTAVIQNEIDFVIQDIALP